MPRPPVDVVQEFLVSAFDRETEDATYVLNIDDPRSAGGDVARARPGDRRRTQDDASDDLRVGP